MSLHPRIYLYLIHSAFGIDAGNESHQIMIHSHSCMSGFYFLVDFNRMRTRFRQCNENPISLLLFFFIFYFVLAVYWAHRVHSVIIGMSHKHSNFIRICNNCCRIYIIFFSPIVCRCSLLVGCCMLQIKYS